MGDDWETSTNPAVLAGGGGRRRKAPEEPKVAGSALLGALTQGS